VATSRTYLFCGLIVAATTIAIVLAGRRGGNAAERDDAPLPVFDPLSLDGEIADAAWRAEKQVGEELDVEHPLRRAPSLLGVHEEEELAKRDAELRKVLDPIEGLGVYVAAGDPESAPDAGRPKRPSAGTR
jgi:hypothetical protein